MNVFLPSCGAQKSKISITLPKSKCLQSYVPSGGFRGRICFLNFAASVGCQDSLTTSSKLSHYGHITFSSSVFYSLTLSLSLINVLMITFKAHTDIQGNLPISRPLTYSQLKIKTKSLFPCKVTFTSFKDWA